MDIYRRLADLECLVWGLAGLLLRQRLEQLAPQPAATVPEPDGCCLLSFFAVEPVNPGDPVFQTGVVAGVRQLDGTGGAVRAFVGFAETAAGAGARLVVRVAGLAELFAGLTPGEEYFVHSGGPPVLLSTVPDGAYYRSVGVATTDRALVFSRGALFRRGSDMALVPAAIETATGAIGVDTTAITVQTAPAGANFSAARTALYADGSGNVFPLDGTAPNGVKFGGVSDGSAVTTGNPVTFFPVGAKLSVTALTRGDLWANELGVLGPFSAVGSTKYGKRVLNVLPSGLEAVVIDGELVMHT
jgi:hypothetical protein